MAKPKTPAKRAEQTAKKPLAKKLTPKKSLATKPTAKKSLAKKSLAKKPLAKKSLAKRPLAKSLAKKPTPKKPTANKPVAKSVPAKGAVVFRDPGLRLAVINALLEQGHFTSALEKAREKGGDVDDYEIDPVVKRAVDAFVLTPELLAKVTSLSPDGGDDIYDALIPVWDGESDEFDIASLEDLPLLPNLASIHLYAMCGKGLDLTPLAGAKKLETVRVSLGEGWAKGTAVLARLKARGVTVEG